MFSEALFHAFIAVIAISSFLGILQLIEIKHELKKISFYANIRMKYKGYAKNNEG